MLWNLLYAYNALNMADYNATFYFRARNIHAVKDWRNPTASFSIESPVVGDEMDISIATIDANISFAQSDAIFRERVLI